LPGATVQLVAENGLILGQAQADSRGVFVIRDVAPGPWRLRAQANGYTQVETTIQVDSSGASGEVEIPLRAAQGSG
jgi:hypothetical protein